jgi:hypothetical protein
MRSPFQSLLVDTIIVGAGRYLGDGCDSRACIGARYVVAWRSPVRFMAIMAVLVARESAMWGQIAKAVEPR